LDKTAAQGVAYVYWLPAGSLARIWRGRKRSAQGLSGWFAEAWMGY